MISSCVGAVLVEVLIDEVDAGRSEPPVSGCSSAQIDQLLDAQALRADVVIEAVLQIGIELLFLVAATAEGTGSAIVASSRQRFIVGVDGASP